MAKKTKASPEKLYGSTLSWEGWSFRILSSETGLRWIELSSTPIDDLARRLRARILPDDVPNELALDELHRYLRAETREFTVTLDIRGTPFQRAVWESLTAIPYGKTAAYSEIAAALGNPQAARAVGQAVGTNPLPMVIPCHRVLGKDERLVGYSGGLPLKERLLMLERGSLSL